MPSITQSSGPVAAVKCACKRCQCLVAPGKGVVRDGRIYCSRACAYDCTDLTCVCVHENCSTQH